MSDYPATFYNPRQMENWPGVEFDPDKRTLAFKEDFDAIKNEILAIEAALGLNFRNNINIEDNGEVSLPKQSRVKAYILSGTQSIPNEIWTKISYDGLLWDNQGEFSINNKRFVAEKDGYYHISAQVLWLSNPIANAIFNIALRVNNVVVLYKFFYRPADSLWTQTISTDLELSANDYVEVWVYQASGSTRQIADGALSSILAIVKFN